MGLDADRTFVGGVRGGLACLDAVHLAWIDADLGGLGVTPFDPDGVLVDLDVVHEALDASQVEVLDEALKVLDEDFDVVLDLGEDLEELGRKKDDKFYFSTRNIKS